ncbi:N-acetylmuramoyl-L-alanine amidase [bacterium]|nr:N-acetylmuramoyl-L-alanine amidase [bacterium]MBU1993573.1 N-acetylmuramoyl-L-alanine amidase [bacterium]
MLRAVFLLVCAYALIEACEIKQTPINFDESRVELTKKYIKSSYNLDVEDIKIIPKIIIIHHTGIDDFNTSLSWFIEPKLLNNRPYIAMAGNVNVSAHFMVEQDGTVHQLMPDNIMARHVIGLNYNSIGIENVGGADFKDNLTLAQLEANVRLINHLKKKYDTIEYVAGHYEYRCFEKNALWLEMNENYRTVKRDPSERFMRDLRKNIKGFKEAPCD